MRRLNLTAQIGLVVILFAVGLLVFYVLRRPPESAQQANNTNGNMVLVSAPGQEQPAPSGLSFKARYDIPQRSILTPDMFEPARLGENESDDVYVTSLRTQGVGFVTAKPILKGRKLRHDDLLGHLSGLGVSAALQDGYRAMAIPVANKATLHDIVAVGDFVDVVATFDQSETRVLADGVRVLAVDVYGANYEKASVAKRGANHGDDRPGGPPPPPDANGKPTTPSANGEPAPTAVPAQGAPPPPRPEASITLEVRPEQAGAIALAQASNAPLDFLIQPRPTTLTLPTLTEVRVTKPMIAPYAVASKRSGGGAAPANPVREVSTGSRRPVNNQPVPNFFPRPDGMGGGVTGLGPMPIPQKKTYDITIYPDGLPPRTNTVALPE